MGEGVALRTRSYRHMRAEEPETLSLGLAHGQSVRTVAAVLARAPSTLSRESARNAGRLHRVAPTGECRTKEGA